MNRERELENWLAGVRLPLRMSLRLASDGPIAQRSPGESKHKEVRYLDIHEDDRLDEELVASWIRLASELPGWGP